ncbi:type II toxin-antitoxin system VapC family toxin [Candidatus Sumerlaeota bacterium]|nr:type II toxin-antitoxin system VapC family toxin [Candidatus Sumerlaeota bacterium]
MSRDLLVAAHRQITADWWERVLPRLEPVVSQLVIEEIGMGDPDVARRRLDAVRDFPLLAMSPEVAELAEEYRNANRIPDHAWTDAVHMALAAWHEADYLVSWNCAHIVGANARAAAQKVNDRKGIFNPIVCTPEELMEG